MMKSSRYQFQVIPAHGEQWVYYIDKPEVRIGRAKRCDLVINDNMVSREHCLFRLEPEGPVVEDLNSFNGTLVNNVRIARSRLKPRDIIRIGSCEMVFNHAFEVTSREPSVTSRQKILEPIPISLAAANEPQPKILVIHPNCSCIEELLSALKDSGARVEVVPSVVNIVSVFQDFPADCCIVCGDIQNLADLCRLIRTRDRFLPLILLANDSDLAGKCTLFEADIDEVLTRLDPVELLVRVKRMLELSLLRRKMRTQPERVQPVDDAGENRKFKRLERYLSPQIVSALLSEEKSQVFHPVRRELTTVFCDLRNYTHFSEISEPEEILSMLNDFHSDFGEVVLKYDGTIERFAGDGILTFFGAPIPCEDHALRAVSMAVEARERLRDVMKKWQRLGYDLDIAFGIATGHVFVGNIGFQGRMDYAAIGKTTNLAARLCSAAKGGQILISQRTQFFVEAVVDLEEIGALQVKGFSGPVVAYNALGLKTSSRAPG